MEAMRDQRGLPWLEDLARDFRHGLSGLRRRPGFAAVAILTLGLGIGANTAIFSVVHAVLFQPLPFDAPDRLVAKNFVSPAGEYVVLHDRVRSLESLALYDTGLAVNLAAEGELPERASASHVSDTFFPTLGVEPLLGRSFRPGENEPGAAGVVVVSHALWRQRYGGDPAIVGRDILVDSEPRTVVGVMPPSFAFPSAGVRIWLPFRLDRLSAVDLWGSRAPRGLIVGRLAPGATPAEVRAELLSAVPEMRAANTIWRLPPDYGQGWQILPLQEQVVGDVRTRLLVIFGAVGCVLLIACANVAGLLLADARGRRREFAVRHALGAARGRLVRQLLTESAVLGLLGGGAGLLLAVWGVPVLLGALPDDIPRAGEIGVDVWVLGFTLLVSLLTGLAFGAVPALRASRSDVQASLRSESRESSGSPGRAAGALVVGEVAVAVLLVIGAGLLIRSFVELLQVEPGFNAAGIVTARITPPESRFGNESDPLLTDELHAPRRVFYDLVLERVARLPGVEVVEASSLPPLVPFGGGVGQYIFETEDDRSVPGQPASAFWDRRVTPGYLRLMGLTIVRGRTLQDSDRFQAVAVINETMAREHWPGENPVDKRFKVSWSEDWITVVGVVRDVMYNGPAEDIGPEAYRPFAYLPASDMSLVMRTSLPPAVLSARLREAVAEVDPTVPVSDVRMLDQFAANAVAGSRFTTLLLGAFAAVALALAAVGIYGLLSYVVSRRTREIGVRMALGAPRAGVLMIVLGRAFALTLAGTLLGIGAALGATRLLQGLLFGVSTTDALTFAAVPVLLVIVALVAAYLPASRATRIDPTVALRLE
jgi:predicted permease